MRISRLRQRLVRKRSFAIADKCVPRRAGSTSRTAPMSASPSALPKSRTSSRSALLQTEDEVQLDLHALGDRCLFDLKPGVLTALDLDRLLVDDDLHEL